ncbi:MAG TPA: putative toxin-antitoxin system toxin component, PIN family [Desulfotomaculum sp.]|nr:putative toxin-antitoxin system toxin component, PIN family [Desulfotomaculum sp.]
MRVVLDTNTLVSAIGWAGTPHRLLRACMQGKLELFISPALIDELSLVITYPKLKVVAMHPDLPRVMAWLCQPEHLVIPRQQINVIVEDPPDNRVLECALEASAGAIVSGDEHLLKLKSFDGIPILKSFEACNIWNIA